MKDWILGEDRVYKITKKESVWNINADTTTDRKSTFFVSIKINTSDSLGYTLEWTYLNSLSNILKLPKILQNDGKSFQDIKVLYRTDKNGQFLNIKNWEDIKTNLFLLLDAVSKLLSSKNKNGSRVNFEVLKKQYSSKNNLSRLFINDIKNYHFPMAHTLKNNDTLVSQKYLPNMLGKNIIKGMARVYQQSIDYTSSVLVLTKDVIIDKNYNKSIEEDFIHSVAIKNKKKALRRLRKKIKKKRWNVSDNTTYKIDIASAKILYIKNFKKLMSLDKNGLAFVKKTMLMEFVETDLNDNK